MTAETERNTTEIESKATEASSSSTFNWDLSSVGKLVEKLKLPGIDVRAIVESQSKDLKAIVEANLEAYEGIKVIVERRGKDFVDGFAQLPEVVKGLTGKDGLAQHTHLVQSNVERAMTDVRELAEVERTLRGKTWNVLRNHFQQSFSYPQKQKPVQAK
jgi:hypothetical protein